MRWELSDAERAALKRSCQLSHVPEFIEDEDAVATIVALLLKGTAGGRR